MASTASQNESATMSINFLLWGLTFKYLIELRKLRQELLWCGEWSLACACSHKETIVLHDWNLIHMQHSSSLGTRPWYNHKHANIMFNYFLMYHSAVILQQLKNYTAKF